MQYVQQFIDRPPKQSDKNPFPRNNYLGQIKQEIDEIVMWLSLQKQTVVLVGDLNTDKLKPNEREKKILLDLKEVTDMTCMISEPTKIQ